jgi:sec-independent protein translocase protein TatB
MFDIGFWELAILFGLGLVVLGPERLPRVANQVGGWMGQARRMARQLTTQLRSELDLESINRPPPPTYRPPKAAPETNRTADHGPGLEPDENPDAEPPPGGDEADIVDTTPSSTQAAEAPVADAGPDTEAPQAAVAAETEAPMEDFGVPAEEVTDTAEAEKDEVAS